MPDDGVKLRLQTDAPYGFTHAGLTKTPSLEYLRAGSALGGLSSNTKPMFPSIAALNNVG